MTTSTRLGLTDLEQNQALPEPVVNGNDRIIEQGANQFIVKDKDLATPPGSPAESDAYIIAGSPTGAWTGRPNQITWFENGAWRFVVPIEGTHAYVQDENLNYQYTGSAWSTADITGLLDFKGSTDCSGNPNYPAASKGDFYLVSVAGKIGGASGIVVEAGDTYFAIADNAGGTQASVGSSWTVIQGNITSYLPLSGGTLTGDLVVPDEAYDATNWNGSLEVPTKNAVRDKIEALSSTSIAAKDEGSTLTSAMTSIDFVGAGVTATNVGGDVTVNISGGGYNAENARDDVGAALVAGTGIGIVLDDGADTITITAKNAYEAGPVTAATTADLATWVNQGTSTVSDGTGALILKPQVDGFVHGREKTAPSAPYDIYMKVDFDFLSSQAATTGIVGAAGILMRDNSDGEILTWCLYYERIAGDEQNTYGVIAQRWTNATTFSATPLLRFNGRPWKWIRVNITSTTVTFYASQDGKNWTQAGTETISTFVDTIDRIGVVGIASANATEGIITVPYFSTTAPS